MSAATAGKSARGWLGAAVMTLAIMVSLFVTTVLVSANLYGRKRVLESRVLATVVPASGALLGENAVDGMEWGLPEGAERMLVLFGVAQTGQPGDVDYWREVASRSREALPDTQFVGLCLAGANCNPSPGADARLTLLKSMDPVQTHALAVAVRQRRAFVFNGSQPAGALAIRTDREAFAAQLARIVNLKAKPGAGGA